MYWSTGYMGNLMASGSHNSGALRPALVKKSHNPNFRIDNGEKHNYKHQEENSFRLSSKYIVIRTWHFESIGSTLKVKWNWVFCLFLITGCRTAGQWIALFLFEDLEIFSPVSEKPIYKALFCSKCIDYQFPLTSRKNIHIQVTEINVSSQNLFLEQHVTYYINIS